MRNDLSIRQGRLIDVKLTSNKIWVLKEDGLVVQDLLSPDGNGYVYHILTFHSFTSVLCSFAFPLYLFTYLVVIILAYITNCAIMTAMAIFYITLYG